MGTLVEIVIYEDDHDKAEQAVNQAFEEIRRLDKLLSRHYPDSDVSRLSQSQHGDTVSAEATEIITLGLDVASKSNGAFDLTLGQLKLLWGFGEEEPVVPAEKDRLKALQGIGPHALKVEKTTVTKASPHLMVDLGGIAKGYAVDRAVDILRNHGIDSGAVNAGGDMFLIGQRPDRPWRIGIQHPRQNDSALATIEVVDKAIVTSGDYERYFEQDGKRYHHIFDPASGLPADQCQSVTVIAGSVALADALATALFVSGPEQGLALLKNYPGVDVHIVAANGKAHVSSGWERYLSTP